MTNLAEAKKTYEIVSIHKTCKRYACMRAGRQVKSYLKAVQAEANEGESLLGMCECDYYFLL